MIYQEKGVMIRQTNYSESSRIITILNDKGMSVPLMVRGFNKPNNPFTSLRQGFQEVLFTYSRHKGMGTLIEVDIVNPFRKLNQDFDLYTAASYVLEIISRIIDEERPDNKLYELLIRAFNLLNEKNEMYAVLSFVLIKIFPKYGVYLNVDRCASCGTYDFKKMNRYSFRFHGILCTDCQTEENQYQSVAVENRTVYLAAYLKHVKINDLNSININRNNAIKLFKFVEMLFNEYTGEFFKTRKLLDI